MYTQTDYYFLISYQPLVISERDKQRGQCESAYHRERQTARERERERETATEREREQERGLD